MADNDVRVPRSALAAMVVLMAVSLLGFAFLLGRQSAPSQTSGPARQVVVQSSGEAPPSQPLRVGSAPSQVEAPPLAPAPAPVAEAPPPPAPAPVQAVPPPAPAAPVPPVASVAPAPPPAPVPPAPAQVQPPMGPSSAVKAYFAKIDKIMAQTEAIGDTNAFATQILQQGMNGKTEGFDNLISSTRKAAQALRSISPPGNCREHYQLLVKQTEQSLSLLEKVKKATVNLDSGELTSLGAEGQNMQNDANRLKQLDEQLRRGY